MKIAVMQPYFFPYIGYFRLIQTCDKFVFFNDVQYIRRGWVNRNRIHCSNKEFQYLTVPIQKVSRDSLIKDIKIDYSSDWHSQHMLAMLHSYGKNKPRSIVEMYSQIPQFSHLQDLLVYTTKKTCEIMGITAEFLFSSSIEVESINECGPHKRLIEICRSLGGDCYVNLPGGRSLYNQDQFRKYGLKLNFVDVPDLNKLSIIDYLANEEA